MKDLHEDNMFGSVRERLGRYEEAPSEELWERIAAGQNVKESAWPFWVENASFVLTGVLLLLTLNVNDPAEVSNKLEVSNKEMQVEIQGGASELIAASKPQAAISTTRQNSDTHLNFDTRPAAHNTELPVTLNVEPETTILNASQPVIATDSTIISETPPSPPKKSKTEEAVPPYKKSKSKFQLYFSLTPSLSFQKIIPNSNDEIIIEGFENRSPLSIKRFGFGIDAGFERDIDHIFGYYGGVSFYRQQQEISYRYFDQEADVNRVGDDWTFEINRPQHTRTFDYSMTNIGVRSGILVTLKGDKLKHKFGAGLIYSHGFAKSTGSYNNSQSSYLSYQVFYRSEVRINEHVSWFVEPTFVYGFLSKEKLAEPFSLKPYRAGLSLGALYRF